MKLILKFGLAALLAAFLAAPALAREHGGGTSHPSESYKAPPAAPSPAREAPETQTKRPAIGEVKGESIDDKHKDQIESLNTPKGSRVPSSGVKGEATPQQRFDPYKNFTVSCQLRLCGRHAPQSKNGFGG